MRKSNAWRYHILTDKAYSIELNKRVENVKSIALRIVLVYFLTNFFESILFGVWSDTETAANRSRNAYKECKTFF